MRYRPSAFYSNFSVAELVRKRGSRAGAVCSAGAMGGGGAGGGSHSAGAKESRYHKTESFTCHIDPGRRAEFDASELMRSLKADVEGEIHRSGARVLGGGDSPSGFFVEYGEEGIRGRVELTGGFRVPDYFGLTAALAETSTTGKKPVVEGGGHERRPAGDYHVVRFSRDEPRAAAQEFYAAGQRAIKESTERLRQKLLADPSAKDSLLRSVEYAEVYEWRPMPPEIRRRFEEAVGEELGPPAEYDGHGNVYFLNDAALRMYREAGEDFTVWKTVPAEEVAKVSGPSLRGPYLAEGVSSSGRAAAVTTYPTV